MLHYGRIVLLSILFLGCSFSETNPDVENVLARINDLTVSVPHFENAFKEYFYRTGQVLTPSESTKKAILDSEFNTYVLAVHARDLGLDETDEAKFQKLAIEKRVLTEEFLNQILNAEITVTEQDLREYFLRFNTKLRASHIYASSLEQAEDYYDRLVNGETFDTLAEEAFLNKYLKENGGDIGWFTTDELDVSFEETVFNLNTGEFSAPVKTAQGYSIIKLTDSQVNPLITEQDFANNKARLASYTRSKKEELHQRRHLSEFTEQLTLNADLVADLFQMISSSSGKWASKDAEFVSNLSKFDGELARYEEFSFEVDDFIEEYFASTTQMLNVVQDPSSFNNFIHGVAYRAYMVERAVNAGIDEQSVVQSSIQETYLHYLEGLVMQELEQSIQTTPAELYKTFQDNQDRFYQPMLVDVQRLVVENEEKAEELISEYTSGKAFENLILNHSINNEDRLMNGKLGYLEIDEFGFNSAQIANLDIGDVSKPITYATGEIHVYKVLDKIEARPLTFDEAKAKVDDFLTQKKLSELRSSTIARVKEKHDAIINTERLNALTIKI